MHQLKVEPLCKVCTTDPIVMFGTKRAIHHIDMNPGQAPVVSTARTSSPKRAKSADRTEAAVMIEGVRPRLLAPSALSMEALAGVIAHAPRAARRLGLRRLPLDRLNACRRQTRESRCTTVTVSNWLRCIGGNPVTAATARLSAGVGFLSSNA
jgi:hypothetical protein